MKQEFAKMILVLVLTLVSHVLVISAWTQDTNGDISLSTDMQNILNLQINSTTSDISILNALQALENKEVSNAQTTTTAQPFTIPLQKKLAVILVGTGWVLDVQKSDISQSTTSNIILLFLQEYKNATLFMFSRSTPGENTLVFTRSDNTTSDVFFYTAAISWIDENSDNTVFPSAMVNDGSAVIVAVEKEVSDNDAGVILKKDISRSADIKDVDNAITNTAPTKNSDTLPNRDEPSSVEKDAPVSLQESAGDESGAGTHGTDINFTTDNDVLADVKTLFAKGNYTEAQKTLLAVLENPEIDISLQLFELAQYLENMHLQQNGSKDVRNVEAAVALYNRIIESYPLSSEYQQAVIRMQFLKKKYISIR